MLFRKLRSLILAVLVFVLAGHSIYKAREFARAALREKTTTVAMFRRIIIYFTASDSTTIAAPTISVSTDPSTLDLQTALKGLLTMRPKESLRALPGPGPEPKHLFTTTQLTLH